MSFIVAIDGPAGSGKGTITKLVGEKEGLINIDTMDIIFLYQFWKYRWNPYNIAFLFHVMLL